MNPIYIKGIGILCKAAASKEELMGLVQSEPADVVSLGGEVDIPSLVPKSKLRRCPRYVKLSATAAAMALADGGFSDSQDKACIGAVLATGYGSKSSNISFSDTLADAGPHMCSPAIFPYTVPNSALGMVCIATGISGPSSMLLGMNPLEYAQLLLNLDKADYILAGAVEEYSEELAEAFRINGREGAAGYAEGSAMLLLSNRPEDGTWGKLVAVQEASLLDGDAEKNISRCIAELMQKSDIKPQVVLASAGESSIAQLETECLRSYFGDIRIINPELVMGNTLGCGFLMKAAYGAALIRAGLYSSVLIAGFEGASGYSTALLAASD